MKPAPVSSAVHSFRQLMHFRVRLSGFTIDDGATLQFVTIARHLAFELYRGALNGEFTPIYDRDA